MSAISFNLLTEPKFGRAKRIKVWQNGESRCYDFTINPRNFRSWIAILSHITSVIQPTFGAIKKMMALGTMQFIESFEDLDPNEKYVALGNNCKFKDAPGGYKEEKELALKKGARKFYTGDINSKTEPFLMETKRKKLTIVYMAVNGRVNQAPQKVVFKDTDLKSWDVIHKYLNQALEIPEGIKEICTIFGQVLKKPAEFQHGYLYVAVPFHENFVMKDYAANLRGGNKYKSSYTLSIRPSSASHITQIWPVRNNGRGETVSTSSNSKCDESSEPTDETSVSTA